jgi:endoglucanase Acf2
VGNNVWIPLLSAFAGAVIGSLTTIGGLFIQAHFQDKREKMKIAFEAAIEDHKVAIDVAKTNLRPTTVAPLAAYICYHTKMTDLALEKKLTKESLEKLDEEMDQLHEVFEKKDKERNSKATK